MRNPWDHPTPNSTTANDEWLDPFEQVEKTEVTRTQPIHVQVSPKSPTPNPTIPFGMDPFASPQPTEPEPFTALPATFDDATPFETGPPPKPLISQDPPDASESAKGPYQEALDDKTWGDGAFAPEDLLSVRVSLPGQGEPLKNASISPVGGAAQESYQPLPERVPLSRLPSMGTGTEGQAFDPSTTYIVSSRIREDLSLAPRAPVPSNYSGQDSNLAAAWESQSELRAVSMDDLRGLQESAGEHVFKGQNLLNRFSRLSIAPPNVANEKGPAGIDQCASTQPLMAPFRDHHTPTEHWLAPLQYEPEQDTPNPFQRGTKHRPSRPIQIHKRPSRRTPVLTTARGAKILVQRRPQRPSLLARVGLFVMRLFGKKEP